MYQTQRFVNAIASQLFGEHRWMLAMLVVMILLSSNNEAVAADPNPFESSPASELASCPVNHKMYYIGANAPTSAINKPVNSQALNWTAGNTNRTFTFSEASGNKTFVIDFPILLDLNTSYGGTPPFYGSINGATTSALNLVHNSPAVKTNHVLNVSINRSVSKVGYKIQDLDSTGSSGQVSYIEQVDVSANQGLLTFNNNFHTRNAAGNIVTARSGVNCGTAGCTIDTAWNYNLPNSILNLKHNNSLTQNNSPHAVGYSDFYFCLAPPKLIVKKALNGARINDTSVKQDQFEIKTTGGSIAANSLTTTGNGTNITNGTSSVLDLAESTSYIITERVMNGTTLGNIANYDATYVCTNSTTNSTTIMPTTAMTYNQAAQTRSFTLSNTNFGDEITCTITNSPKNYTFSGTVFNDNGGITNANADITSSTSPYASNSNYFNGIFDLSAPVEAGIEGSTVKLVNCTTPTTEYATQAVSSTGTYQLTASAVTINSNPNNICLVEVRSDSTYPIRTTPASKTISIVSNTFNYPNNNFGRVITANAALVLRKAQYVNDCPSTLDYTATNLNTTGNTNPKAGFSESPINGTNGNALTPGQCIAYRIIATNRANMVISDFVMRDVLQKKGVNGAQVTSVLANPPLSTTDYNAAENPAIGENGEVKTKTLTLNARTNRNFYFNTKYGSTSNP